MSVSSFTRHLTLSLAFVAVAWASPRQADAAMITQIKNFTLMGSVSQQFTWDQFDPSLGTLTAIQYSVNGELSGSFTVTNFSNTPADVFNSTDVFKTNFVGMGAPPPFDGIAVMPIITTPSTGAAPGTTLPPNPPGGTTQQFDIAAGQNMIVPMTDFMAFQSYFTGLGNVLQDLEQDPRATVSGGNFSLNTNNVTTTGEATLIYIYDADVTVIPEPFTAAFTGLLIGGGAIVGARRKRRLAKAEKKS